MQLSLSQTPKSISSANYLLRQYGGAAAAYSLQRLDTSTTNVVRARESVGDTEADFTAEEVSGGSLREFALQNDADLIRFANQATAADKRMYFDGSDDYVALPFDTSSCTNATITMHDVTIQDTTGILLVNGGAGSPFLMCYQAGDGNASSSGSGTPTTYVDDVAIGTTRANLYTALSDGLPHKVEVRGADLTGWGNIPRLGWYFLSPFQVTGIIGRVSVDYTGDGTLDADYLGQGNTNADWEDQVGSNDGTVNGSPALFSGQGFNAYVTTLYDQSGNGRNATQATAASQPQIVADGVVVTDSNGNATLLFNGSSHQMTATKLDLSAGEYAAFTVVEANTLSLDKVILRNGNGSNNGFILQAGGLGSDREIVYQGVATLVDGTMSVNTTELWSAINNGSITAIYVDGASQSLTNSASTMLTPTGAMIIGSNSGSLYWSGEITEIVIYESEQSSNRAKIEANIASRYGITLA